MGSCADRGVRCKAGHTDFSGFKDSADVGRGMNSFHILKGGRFRFYLDKASGKFPVYHPVYFLNPPWVFRVGMTGFVLCKPVIPGHPHP
jgi:hypothetical protein